MKSIFALVSKDCSKIVTKTYTTSFSMATKMLASSIRQDIYNIYGFVRFADEIVDTFHNYDKETLLNRFIDELEYSLNNNITLSINFLSGSFLIIYITEDISFFVYSDLGELKISLL